MPDPLEQVLRLVAEGRLTAEEAAPILDALGTRPDTPGEVLPDVEPPDSDPEPSNRPASWLRLEVREDGRKVVNLRIPVSLGRFALDRVPGLAGANVDHVRQAVASGRTGTVLVVDDEDGDGVRIALE